MLVLLVHPATGWLLAVRGALRSRGIDVVVARDTVGAAAHAARADAIVAEDGLLRGAAFLAEAVRRRPTAAFVCGTFGTPGAWPDVAGLLPDDVADAVAAQVGRVGALPAVA